MSARHCFSFPDGYVKTESVEIDIDSLKTHGRALPESDGDVYDDVGSQEEANRYAITTPQRHSWAPGGTCIWSPICSCCLVHSYDCVLFQEHQWSRRWVQNAWFNIIQICGLNTNEDAWLNKTHEELRAVPHSWLTLPSAVPSYSASSTWGTWRYIRWSGRFQPYCQVRACVRRIYYRAQGCQIPLKEMFSSESKRVRIRMRYRTCLSRLTFT